MSLLSKAAFICTEKKTCLIKEGGPKNVLCWYRMSDRMLKKIKCLVNIFKLLFVIYFFI